MSIALEQLKSQLKVLGGFHEREYLHSQAGSQNVSIPKGAITQVVGPGKSEVLAQMLASASKASPLKIAWIEDELSLYPIGLKQRALALQNILIVEAGEQILWASLQTLASGLFQVVVISAQETRTLAELRNLRRLQLASEKSKTSLVLLTEELISAWPISLNLEASQFGVTP